jgi:DNA end-binding protein Ku
MLLLKTMKSIWKGSINFGLVYIPVAVYPATREEKTAFKQLRASDLSPIRYQKVAEADDKEVPAKDIVKGYEYEKGKWIVMEDADFEKVEIASTQTVEITDFVNVSDINPKFFYKPYFLETQKGGEKAYALLHRALTETGRIGIAKVAIRTREYLAAVKPDGLFLILELMHFAQEVLEPEDLRVANDAALSPKELQMAKALIESMTGEWQPAQYENRYQAALMEVIEEKIQKRPHAAKLPPRKTAGDVVDLLAVLKSSLEGNRNMKKPPRKPAEPASRSTLALVKPQRQKAAA